MIHPTPTSTARAFTSSAGLNSDNSWPGAVTVRHEARYLYSPTIQESLQDLQNEMKATKVEGS